MTNDIATKQNGDGFDSFEAGTEGETQFDSVIKGQLLKFSNTAAWVAGEEELPKDIELLAVDIIRVVQRWVDGRPAETKILGPGERFPNVAAMNESVPKSEWIEGPTGDLVGPWQAQHLVYLLDEESMSRFTFATGTVGGSIATRELAEKTAWKRRMNGEFVYPVVRLADKHMNTRFGGRQRPHFEIVRWTSFGTGNGALAAPQQSALAAPAKNVWEQFTEAEAVKPAQPGAVLHDDDLNWKALISKKDSKRLSA